MIIKTKKESLQKIKELNLNHFEEDIFQKSEIEAIKKFFQNNPAKEYCLRDTNNTSGKFFFIKSFEECLSKLDEYEKFVTICISANEYDDDIILLGDIKVSNEFGNESIDLTARDDKDADHRNIYENPKYNFHTSLEDDKIWNIPGFSKLINYISQHDLYNVILEFAVYDCPVGVNKEPVVIFEIRSQF